MFGLFQTRFQDVLGLNARTISYIGRVNQAEPTKLANRKLATKRILQKAGLPTPRLYGKITSHRDLHNFRWTKLPASFVLKPNSASGGGGILVVFGRNKKGHWVKADKSEIFIPELRSRVLDILDGSYSPGNIPDSAFFEQRVKITSQLKPYSHQGLPDIRVLVYNLVPVMAMLRLPTIESGGRANLHAGGIGVGIDLTTGFTTTAIHNGNLIEEIPGKRLGLSGLRLPHWEQILLTASGAARAAGITYAGVDIAIDRDDGPLILEINARPGLDIQFANLTPLKNRLQKVEGLKVANPTKALQIAKNLFGDETDQDIEDISGRTVLGIDEPIKIIDSDGQSRGTLAKIDTGAWRTAIDINLAKKYGIDRPIVSKKHVRAALGSDTRPVVSISFLLKNRLIETEAFLTDRSHMNYDIIIGRRDLSGFLVDPSKAKSSRAEK